MEMENRGRIWGSNPGPLGRESGHAFHWSKISLIQRDLDRSLFCARVSTACICVGRFWASRWFVSQRQKAVFRVAFAQNRFPWCQRQRRSYLSNPILHQEGGCIWAAPLRSDKTGAPDPFTCGYDAGPVPHQLQVAMMHVAGPSEPASVVLS